MKDEPAAVRQALRCSVLLSVALLLLLTVPGRSYAFYQWQGEEGSLELTGLLRGAGSRLRNPDNRFYFDDRNISALAGSARGMLHARLGEQLTLEAHGVAGYTPGSLLRAGRRTASMQGTERSDMLEWSRNSGESRLHFDRLNLQYSSGRLSIRAGRQPVNLAATFFFTPNDFFAPFAAQTFYRTYKPGVDAARLDVRTGDLSQLSLIGVLGYRADGSGDTGWSNRPDSGRTSGIVRASGVFGDFELAAVGGIVRRDRVIGGDLQGELFGWLGVRGEGHYAFADDRQQGDHAEFALGLEHRWESSLTLRVEQFFHGSGASSELAYNRQATAQGMYRARHYTAVGANYEVTPLLTGDVAVIHNWVDRSRLLALYTVYSLSDESEAVFSATLPVGRKPQGDVLRSEFGLYPLAAGVEVRRYF